MIRMNDPEGLESLPTASGIYCLMCKGKKYIGSSFNIRRRVKQHIRDLTAKKHCNVKLQRHFIKYGVENFQIHVVELTEHKRIELIKKEEHYISIFKCCTRKHGLNLNSRADRPPADLHKIKFTLRNEDGKDLTFNSITHFCKLTNIERNRVTEILKGKRNNYKGWRLPTVNRNFKYTLRDAQGELHMFDNMNEFATHNNLDFKGINYLLRGKYRHHRGWTCPKYEWRILDLNNNEFIINTTIKDFCIKNNIKNRIKLNAVLLGNSNHYKGWHLPDSV